MIGWHELLEAKNPNPVRSLLCIDPGETTGWSHFAFGRLGEQGQLNSLDSPAHGLNELFCGRSNGRTFEPPSIIVAEDYRVYAHRLAQHTYSDLFTPRLIGMIESECERSNTPLVKQMAAQAKGFATDEKLREWNMWIKGQKHSRDSIRHGIYFLLFGGNLAHAT